MVNKSLIVMFEMELNSQQNEMGEELRFGAYAPVYESKIDCWLCEYFIRGQNLNIIEKTHGEDPLQSILITLERIREILEQQNISYYHKGIAVELLLPMHAPAHKYGEKFHHEVELMMKNMIKKKQEEWNENRIKNHKN